MSWGIFRTANCRRISHCSCQRSRIESNDKRESERTHTPTYPFAIGSLTLTITHSFEPNAPNAQRNTIGAVGAFALFYDRFYAATDLRRARHQGVRHANTHTHTHACVPMRNKSSAASPTLSLRAQCCNSPAARAPHSGRVIGARTRALSSRTRIHAIYEPSAHPHMHTSAPSARRCALLCDRMPHAISVKRPGRAHTQQACRNRVCIIKFARLAAAIAAAEWCAIIAWLRFKAVWVCRSIKPHSP